MHITTRNVVFFSLSIMDIAAYTMTLQTNSAIRLLCPSWLSANYNRCPWWSRGYGVIHPSCSVINIYIKHYFFLKQHLLHDIVVGFIFKVMAQELLVFEWFCTCLCLRNELSVHKDGTCQSIYIDQRPKITSLWYLERRQHIESVQ
jgi:hypothetical protein